MKSTGNYSDNTCLSNDSSFDKIERLKAALHDDDAVIIGAGSGLSTAAGLTYTGERFERYFRDFAEKYGIRDMYSGGFYPFPSPNEYWAWWSRHIWVNRYMDAPRDTYKYLHELVKGKDYFVLTTNVDHQFQKAGFDKDRLFYTQGDYGLFQCTDPCCQETWDNEEQVRQMLFAQGFEIGDDNELIISDGTRIRMEVPSNLIPYCEKCGKPLTVNLRADDTFVEDTGWHIAAGKYADYLAEHGIRARGFFTGEGNEKLNKSYSGKILLLELGVGMNTPGIIKYPFWQMTAVNWNLTYACLNYGEAVAPAEISGQSICIDGDITEILQAILK